jgi:predicted ArsR family transcriptional regulator
MEPRSRGEAGGGWTFLTNHSHVLICLARDPDMRIRDLAAEVGITERSVQAIIGDLEQAGCLRRHKEGRRNRYEVIRDRPMRHRVEQGHVIGELLDVLVVETDAETG